MYFKNLKYKLAFLFRKKEQIQRIYFEDSLKHLYDCEYNKTTATILSLTAALELKADKAHEIVNKMSSEGLLVIKPNGLALLPFGRAWALQIIRVHRLWESYLTHEGGVPLKEIHKMADRREHFTSPEEANKLEEKLGYPTHDPHGDPIPTADHKLEESKTTPLVAWPIGLLARVAHIEDEPQSIFNQILAEGLVPDTYVEIKESGPKGFLIAINGVESWLAPIVAANVFVEEAPVLIQKTQLNMEPISSLKFGEKGKILLLEGEGDERDQLTSLGLLPGIIIQSESDATSDYITFIVNGEKIRLSTAQTQRIFIKRIAKDHMEPQG